MQGRRAVAYSLSGKGTNPKVKGKRIQHYVHKYRLPDSVQRQVYLHPYPKELMLRNHV